MTTAAPRSLARVRLSGRAMTLHRALQSSAALFALVALVALFFPVHEVRDSGFGQALGCAFMPDCHVSPSAPRSEAEVLASPPDAVHTGIHHGGAGVVAVFLLLAAGELLSLLRPRFWVGLVTACAGLVAAGGALFMTEFDLSHMFEHVHRLPAWRIHEGAVIGLALAALVDVFAQPILYVRARWIERRARPPELPAARARPGPAASVSRGAPER